MPAPTVLAMASQINQPDDRDHLTLVDRTDCRFGPRRVDPLLERQKLAGEEDQSVPGWDQGA